MKEDEHSSIEIKNLQKHILYYAENPYFHHV